MVGWNRFAIGQSSLDYYGLDCGTGRWVMFLQGGMDTMKDFDSFDAFFERLLNLIGYQEDQSELFRSLLPPTS